MVEPKVAPAVMVGLTGTNKLPAGTTTVDGVMVAMAGLLLVNVTVTPPAGATVESDTGTLPVAVGPSVRLPIVSALLVTAALLVVGISGGDVAVMVVLPKAMPVMVNVTEVCPTGTNTLAGTVRIPVFALTSVTVVPPAGAGVGSVTVPVEVPAIGVSGRVKVRLVTPSAIVTVPVAGDPTPCAAFASIVKITVRLGSGTPLLTGTIVSVTVVCPARNVIGLEIALYPILLFAVPVMLNDALSAAAILPPVRVNVN